MSASTSESTSTTPKLKTSSHGREPSETNPPLPPPTLRLVKDEEEIDVYSANPYPTRPEHVLPPPTSRQRAPIYSQGHDGEPSDAGGEVSYTFQDPASSVESFREPFGDPHGGSVSEFSSIAQGGASSSSQIWLEDANSSKTSVGHSPIRQVSDEPEDDEGETHGHGHAHANSSGSNSSGITLPPAQTLTIKTVQPESSPQSTPSRHVTTAHHTPPSNNSATSSPNLVPLASSSPNIVPVSGSSSPNIVREQSSDSSLYSANSVGTARRYPQQSPTRPIASYIYSDFEGSSSPSIPSSPPPGALRTYQSDSSLGLPPPETTYARVRDSSTQEDTPSSSDVQSVSSSGTQVQYPTVRAPPSTGSWAESSSPAPQQQKQQQTQQRLRRPSQQQLSQSMTEHSGPWKPHLSTVPSEWSAERQLSLPSTELSNEGVLVKSPRHLSWNPSSRPSIALVSDLEGENEDVLGSLRPVTSGTRPASTQSSSASRLSSLRSINRPGSSASNGTFFHIIPSWAKVYYKSGGLALQLSALSLVEGSRPSTAATDSNKPSTPSVNGNHNGNAQFVSPMPAKLANPRTRAQPQQQQLQPPPPPEPPQQPQPAHLPDPRDPRAHWREGMSVREASPVTPQDQGSDVNPITWSPHLIPDKHDPAVQKNRWKPPSLDEAAEGLFSLRNAQIYAFCIGFIFPLAWLMASFLPLPQTPNSPDQEPSSSRPDLENALQNTVSSTDYARHESARWWRNVNRIMTPVGFAIIAVVVTLAVLGSRGAL